MREPRKNVLAIVPARGGSRGLPGKNVKNLCGKPLIAYTLEAALGAALVTRVVVSTDDRNIASVAREHGAEVPFMRPSELADDRALVVQAVEYTLNRLKREEGYSPDFIAVLYPTSPFRPAGLVNHLVAIGLEKESPVITVRRIVQDGFSLFVKDKSNKIVPMKIKGHASETGRRSYYRSYGIFNGIMPGSSSSPYLHVLDEEFYFVDIDTEEDFLFAESIINNNLFKFSKQ